jgi:2-polyprenyl-3-methyl-5-hydroxy-6-metoxy-1,4-benzoquinol methylase
MFKVGKVTLDDSHYIGHDIYSDGEVEDEMLEIAKTATCEEYNSIIVERKSWPILYHFSHLRGNIVLSMPITKNCSVLEIGSGCGAVTGALLNKAGEVHSIDLSMKRCLINANRYRERDNLTISVGNFEDIEKSLSQRYDVITLIGVFEYGQLYISSANPYLDFLKKIKRHLNDNGKIIIAIENKYGLKYFAGSKEDHTSRYFEGIEGYRNTNFVKTFSKNGLEKLLKTANLSKYRFYYPYPDYKFTIKMFSDEFMPNPKELTDNNLNLDNARLQLFDEAYVFEGLVNDDLFPLFSNSYLVVIEGY